MGFKTGRWLGAVIVASVLVACSSGGGDSSAKSDARPATSTTRPAVHASTGCGKQPPVTATADAPDVVLPFAAGAQQRSYRFGVPTSYDQQNPAPLILNLHGSGSNAAAESVYSRLPADGGARGYLVVTPDAVDGKWEIAPRGPDDEFLVALLDKVEADYCVDLDRVFAAGISLGAWKAAVTACAHPDRFAAIALVAVEVAPAKCPMPVVAFHGTADPVVPYGEGADPGVVVTGSNAGLPGASINMKTWAANSGCSPDKRVEPIGADVEHWVYDHCARGSGVEFYSIKHGGHTWPGSLDVARLGPTTHTIDATKIALDWFAAHPKRG